MHVLVIPSEEFQPRESHLAGIFQRHQCTAMHQAGWKVGVLSVRLRFSVVMILKGVLIRLCGGIPGRGLEGYRVGELLRLLKDKILHPEKFVSSEVIDGYPVVRINGLYMHRPSPVNEYVSWVRAGKIVFAEFCRRHGAPDLIHAHNCNPAGLLAFEINKATGIPYMITEHSSYYHRRLIPQRLMPRVAISFAAAKVIATVSPALGEDLACDIGKQAAGARWIPNVIDPEFESGDLPEPSTSTGCVFLAVGELIPLKGHRELIDAFTQAFASQLQVRLRIAGDGILVSELQAKISSLGLGNQISLLGRLTRQEVQQEMKSCHCLVLPSHYETFGVVLIEALSLGRPVIASHCGGPECIVNDSNGLLVPPQDVRALAKALTAMRHSFQNYDCVALQRDVRDRFGRQRLLNELNTAYQECISKD